MKHKGWVSLFFLLQVGMPLHAQVKEILSLKPKSTLTYTLQHPMHLIRGTSEKVDCTVMLGEDTAASKIECSAPLNSFDSRNESRDSHMLEVVNGLRFPEVKFSGKPIRREGENWLIAGTLDFHGQVKPIEFKVKTQTDAGGVHVLGKFPISLTAFQIKRPSLLFVKTADTVEIDLDIFAKP